MTRFEEKIIKNPELLYLLLQLYTTQWKAEASIDTKTSVSEIQKIFTKNVALQSLQGQLVGYNINVHTV